MEAKNEFDDYFDFQRYLYSNETVILLPLDNDPASPFIIKDNIIEDYAVKAQTSTIIQQGQNVETRFIGIPVSTTDELTTKIMFSSDGTPTVAARPEAVDSDSTNYELKIPIQFNFMEE